MATGFSRAVGHRVPEVEMVSGCETVTRRDSGVEFSIALEVTQGVGAIRLTLNEAEVRDWHMRLSRALALLDEPSQRQGESSGHTEAGGGDDHDGAV
jgi:hypothetical protein